MKFLKAILCLLVFGLFGCSTQEEVLVNSSKPINEELMKRLDNPDINSYLKKRISFTLHEKGKELNEIISYEQVGLDLLVNFTLTSGISTNMLLQNTFDDNNNFLFLDSGTNVSCEGSCECGLVVIIGQENVYCTGSCDSCAMVFSNFYLTKVIENTSYSEENILIKDLKRIATSSYIKTFNELPSNIEIDKIIEHNGNNNLISYEVIYKSNFNPLGVIIYSKKID